MCHKIGVRDKMVKKVYIARHERSMTQPLPPLVTAYAARRRVQQHQSHRPLYWSLRRAPAGGWQGGRARNTTTTRRTSSERVYIYTSSFSLRIRGRWLMRPLPLAARAALESCWPMVDAATVSAVSVTALTVTAATITCFSTVVFSPYAMTS